jgi:alkanesulfonate monooxygenase SsuD/methylene tetrahydromethanopterin reductase-like flavin-dependent oxidoreductase (luciferase family)
MNVGVGLPNTTPGADGELLVDWSRAADAGPFSSLGVLDRIVYDSYEPLTALAVAAAVTSRIRLATMIVIAPLRNTALLAKQAASVHAIAGGRLTLGLAVGARVEDYEAAAVDPAGRGERFSRQLAELREHWEDARIGPSPASGQRPELLVGGPARAFARAAASANAAWRDLGRPGRPKLWGQAYFTLGDDEAGDEYLRDYYAFTGPFAERIVAGNLRTPRAIRDFVRSYEAEGCDELVLLPTVSTLEQIERLAEVLG